MSAGSRFDVYPCALSGQQGILTAHRVPAPFLRRCLRNHQILTRCGFPARCAMASFYRFRDTRRCGHLKGIWSVPTGTPSKTHTTRQTKPLTSEQPNSSASSVLERSGYESNGDGGSDENGRSWRGRNLRANRKLALTEVILHGFEERPVGPIFVPNFQTGVSILVAASFFALAQLLVILFASLVFLLSRKWLAAQFPVASFNQPTSTPHRLTASS